jgi:Uncharacterized protein conserved in bacteria (DUF2188)
MGKGKSGNQIHVVPQGNKWAVKNDNAQRATVVTSTQAQAAQRAVEIAKNQGKEVTIHRPDGTIRSKDSYGNDPASVKDTEH